ncbi:hypothetical protein C8R42DRAFT_640265 [Lentinula raphanica]|nr:hypothetical protein C8R42DRAFT_640265 [Lentinula raphanica]
MKGSKALQRPGSSITFGGFELRGNIRNPDEIKITLEVNGEKEVEGELRCNIPQLNKYVVKLRRAFDEDNNEEFGGIGGGEGLGEVVSKAKTGLRDTTFIQREEGNFAIELCPRIDLTNDYGRMKRKNRRGRWKDGSSGGLAGEMRKRRRGSSINSSTNQSALFALPLQYSSFSSPALPPQTGLADSEADEESLGPSSLLYLFTFLISPTWTHTADLERLSILAITSSPQRQQNQCKLHIGGRDCVCILEEGKVYTGVEVLGNEGDEALLARLITPPSTS